MSQFIQEAFLSPGKVAAPHRTPPHNGNVSGNPCMTNLCMLHNILTILKANLTAQRRIGFARRECLIDLPSKSFADSMMMHSCNMGAIGESPQLAQHTRTIWSLPNIVFPRPD